MDKVYLHNIKTYTKTDQGYLFEKFDLTVLKGISEKGQKNRHTFHGAEIRLMMDSPIKITLNSLDVSEVMIYYGDFQGELFKIEGETTLRLENPFKKEDLNKVMPFYRFHPNCLRILFKESLILKSIEGDYHIPTLDDMPKKKYLAYGTSITQGRNSFTPDLTYPQLIAFELGYDVTNLGMSGSCYIDQALVDDMLKDNYHLITLELSVNMLGDHFSVDTFKQRLTYLLNRIQETQPNAVVVGLSILNNWRCYGFDQQRGTYLDLVAFREAFESLMVNYPNFIFIDGKTVIDKHHLSKDLIHPSQYGMIEIANHILAKLKDVI